MANSAFLSGTSSNPLLRLHLQVESPISCELNDSFICSLLVHAHALGLRHLIINGYWQFEAAIHDVFSINSLESLSVRIILQMTIPSAIALTRLKCLSINLTTYKTQIEQLLLIVLFGRFTTLCGLRGCLPVLPNGKKKLELLLSSSVLHPDSLPLRLSMASLEFLDVKNRRILEDIRCIHGEIPFLRKAVVTLRGLRPNHVTVVAQFLNFMSHVEELSLNLNEH